MGLGNPSIKGSLLYEDNDACTAMANARKPTPRTRHIDIKWFALCEWVERDLIKLVRVHTSLNMADQMTKSLGPTVFHRHNDYIMGHVPPAYARYMIETVDDVIGADAAQGVDTKIDDLENEMI